MLFNKQQLLRLQQSKNKQLLRSSSSTKYHILNQNPQLYDFEKLHNESQKIYNKRVHNNPSNRPSFQNVQKIQQMPNEELQFNSISNAKKINTFYMKDLELQKKKAKNYLHLKQKIEIKEKEQLEKERNRQLQKTRSAQNLHEKEKRSYKNMYLQKINPMKSKKPLTKIGFKMETSVKLKWNEKQRTTKPNQSKIINLIQQRFKKVKESKKQMIEQELSVEVNYKLNPQHQQQSKHIQSMNVSINNVSDCQIVIIHDFNEEIGHQIFIENKQDQEEPTSMIQNREEFLIDRDNQSQKDNKDYKQNQEDSSEIVIQNEDEENASENVIQNEDEENASENVIQNEGEETNKYDLADE